MRKNNITEFNTAFYAYCANNLGIAPTDFPAPKVTVEQAQPLRYVIILGADAESRSMVVSLTDAGIPFESDDHGVCVAKLTEPQLMRLTERLQQMANPVCDVSDVSGLGITQDRWP